MTKNLIIELEIPENSYLIFDNYEIENGNLQVKYSDSNSSSLSSWTTTKTNEFKNENTKKLKIAGSGINFGEDPILTAQHNRHHDHDRGGKLETRYCGPGVKFHSKVDDVPPEFVAPLGVGVGVGVAAPVAAVGVGVGAVGGFGVGAVGFGVSPGLALGSGYGLGYGYNGFGVNPYGLGGLGGVGGVGFGLGYPRYI